MPVLRSRPSFHNTNLRTRAVASESQSSLLDGLVAWWKMDEESGTRLDASGNGYHLTDNNTCGFSPGLVLNAVNMVNANNEWLNNSGVEPNGFWTFACFFKRNGTHSINEFFDNHGSRGIIALTRADTNVLTFQAWDSDNTRADGNRSNFTTPEDNNWHHYVFYVDDSDRKAYSIVDNDTPTTTSGVLNTGGIFTTPGQSIGIGGYLIPGANGDFDLVGIWNRNLTVAEIAKLYNGGSGLDYPFG